jgi:hypothetical protein
LPNRCTRSTTATTTLRATTSCSRACTLCTVQCSSLKSPQKARLEPLTVRTDTPPTYAQTPCSQMLLVAHVTNSLNQTCKTKLSTHQTKQTNRVASFNLSRCHFSRNLLTRQGEPLARQTWAVLRHQRKACSASWGSTGAPSGDARGGIGTTYIHHMHTLTIHSPYSPYTRHTHHTLAIHSPYTHHTLLTIHPPYTHHTLTIHSPYTHHTLAILTMHSPYTHHTLTIHTPYTHHTLTIHSPYTHHTHHTLTTLASGGDRYASTTILYSPYCTHITALYLHCTHYTLLTILCMAGIGTTYIHHTHQTLTILSPYAHHTLTTLTMHSHTRTGGVVPGRGRRGSQE